MECSCRLWPIPGMYVVTSTLLVSRARATLRRAELGFLRVCVYTRIHTPRFSGHPCSAGDFVLVRTFSRPLRTSCANVGTALPHTSKNLISFPAGFHRHAEFRGLSTERVSSDPGGPTRFSTQTIHCGFHGSGSSEEAYSALRGWRPIPAALLAPSLISIFRSRRPSPSTTGRNPPDKTLSIGTKGFYVKIKKAFQSRMLSARGMHWLGDRTGRMYKQAGQPRSRLAT